MRAREEQPTEPAWRRLVLSLVIVLVALAVPAHAVAAAGWYHDRTYGATPRPLGDNNHVDGMASDPWGNVYVADNYNHRAQKFDPTRTSVLAFGTAMLGQGGLRNPQGVGVSPVDGAVYVTDSNNRKVEKFDSSGQSVLSFGSAGTGNGQFGGGMAGIAVRSDGEVWVSDTGNHRIQRFSSSGAYLGQFGSSGTATGRFNGPRGSCFASNGDFYVADTGNNRVQRFTNTGTFVAAYGSAGSGNGQFNAPRQVACSADGAQFAVADTNNHRVQRFSSSFAYVGQMGSNGTGTGQFQGANGVAIDSTGRIWASDFDGSRVHVYEADGTYVGEAGQSNLAPDRYKNVFGVAANASGSRVYVSDTNNGRVQYYDQDGNWLGAFGSTGTGDGQFQLAYDLDVDASGNVYVVDQQNHRVQKFSANGTFLAKWGSNGTANGRFSAPWGIAISPVDGTVAVADTGNRRVQLFSQAGAYLGQFGTSGTGNGQFNSPHGLAYDASGDIYVADSGNNRIQKFTSSGVYITQWGTAGTGDGQFTAPSGVAALPDGTVLVVENSNPRIQHFTNTGGFLRKAGTSGIGTGQLGWPRMAHASADGSVYIADASNSRAVRWKLATAGPPNTMFVHDTDAQATSCGGLYCVNPTGITALQPRYSWINQYGASISGQRTRVQTSSLDGVVGLWHFDGDGADASGNGNVMALNGSARYTRGARSFGQALELGTSGRAAAGYHARYSLSSFTIEAWFRSPGPTTGYPFLVHRGVNNENRNYGIYVDGPSQNISFTYSSGGVARYPLGVPGASYMDGLWHHVAATSDGSTVRIYVDGIQRGSGSLLGSFDDPAVGPSVQTGTSSLDVDEVRISNVVRTPEQIAGYYRTRLPHATLLWDSSPTDVPVALASCADGARCADVVHGTGGSQPLGALRGGRYSVQAKFHSGTAWSDWSAGDWYEHATGRPSLGYVGNTGAQAGAGNNTGILALDPRFSWTNNMGRGAAADRRRIQVVTTPLDDVEALWKLDDSPGPLVDSSGNGLSLAAVGTPGAATGAAGFAQARSLNGSSHAYTAPAAAGNTTSHTFEAWIRFTACAAGYPSWTQGVVTKSDASSMGALQLRVDCDGGVHAKASAAGHTELAYAYSDPWFSINDGQWHHVAAVLDGAAKTVTVYVDGKQGERISIAGTIDRVPTQPVRIGTTTSNQWFNGVIDEVRISSVARTAAEIKGYYETRRPHFDTLWDSDPTAAGSVAMASCGDLARCADATYAGATMRYADARYYARARHKDSAKAPWSAWSDWDWYQAQTPPAPTAIRTHDTNADPGSVNPTNIASPTPRFSFVSNAWQSATAQRTQVLTTSLDDVVRLWKLDGTGAESAAGEWVTRNSGVNEPVWVAGAPGFGQALRFDGNDGATARTRPDLDLDEFTVEAWFATTLAGSAPYPTIVVRQASTTQRNFSIFFDRSTTNLCLSMSTAGTQNDRCVPAPAAWRDGSWHHVALTRTAAGAVVLYVDGVARGSWSIPGDVDNPARSVDIGHLSGNYSAAGFVGDIDEVRISRVARTAAEILGAYRTGRPHHTVMWDSSPTDAGAAMTTCASGARCADVTYGTGGGALSLIKAGARYHVRAKVLTQSGSWSAWSLADWFETQVTLTVGVDQATRGLGAATAGADVTGTTVVTVTTNNPTGYRLVATDQHDSNWASRDASTHIPDWTGTDASPTAWPAGTSGFGGITVLGATGGVTTRLAKWGTGTDRAATDFANNLYAGLRSTSSTLLHERTAQHLTADTVTAAYRTNVGPTQAPGTYTGTVTYTAIANP